MDADGLTELFEPFGPVTVRRMFGGSGVYVDGLCFALALNGEVYIKTDAEIRGAFEAAGSQPFVYLARGKPTTVSYFRLVAEAYDDADALKRCAALGLAAAQRAAAKTGARSARAK